MYNRGRILEYAIYKQCDTLSPQRKEVPNNSLYTTNKNSQLENSIDGPYRALIYHRNHPQKNTNQHKYNRNVNRRKQNNCKLAFWKAKATK